MTVNSGFVWQHGRDGDVLVCAPLLHIAPHAFTARGLGPGRTDSEVRHAYGVIAEHLCVEVAAMRDARQVHGTGVYVAGRQRAATVVDADVLLTAEPGVAVVVRTADCTPILLADPKTGAVAAVHAGWRGTCSNAVGSAISALASHFGSRPADLVAAVGPAIGPCCYQVGDDVHEAFLTGRDRAEVAGWFVRDGDRWRLDIWAANRDQLRATGVPAPAIHVARQCTASSLDRYYSHRAEGTATGRQFAAITPAPR